MPSVMPLAVLITSLSLSVQEPTRIVAASNVRLRAAPTPDAAVVATVPLGLEVVQLETGGDGGTWVRVRLPQGADGWAPSRLTRRFSSETRLQTIDALARERLARRGDSFPARVELVEFLERVRRDVPDPEMSGRLAVHWLNAMAHAFDAIPMSLSRTQPYAAWIDARREAIVYNEPAGKWILRREVILDLHTRERDTSAADDIAWFLTRNGLPGECEGFVPCYARRANELEGEYLRRHSAGRHATEAVGRVATQAAAWSAGGAYFYDRARDCRELGTAIQLLREAVALTRVADRSAALSALDRMTCTPPPAAPPSR